MMKLLLTTATALAACGAPAKSDTMADARPGGADAPGSLDASNSSPDLADAGSSTVTTRIVSIPGSAANRALAATIYAPAGTGPLPLVVISPGFQMARTQYASYANHLASWGFVVILTDYAESGFFASHQLMADDIGAVLDYALAPAFTPAIDPAAIGLAGHSLGGDISVLAATAEPRVGAIVGWDPVDGSNPSVVPERMTSFTVPLAVIGETTNASGGFMPCAPAAENFTQFYTAASSPALQMTVANADHMDWVDDPTCFACTLCGDGTADPEIARRATRRLNVAWMRAHLLGDATVQASLLTPPEVGSGAATVTSK